MHVFKCENCKNEFSDKRTLARFCSHSCYSISRKGNVSRNSGQFQKGSSGPWKGKRRPEVKSWLPTYEKGHIPWNDGLSYGKSNWFRKNDIKGYKALHHRIGKVYGKPMKCEHCNREDLSRYHWANVSGQYLEERSDWIRLCPRCHYKYDGSQQKQTWIKKDM